MDGGDEGCVGSVVNVVRLGEVDRTGLWGGRRGASEHDGVLEDLAMAVMVDRPRVGGEPFATKMMGKVALVLDWTVGCVGL